MSYSMLYSSDYQLTLKSKPTESEDITIICIVSILVYVKNANTPSNNKTDIFITGT